MYVPQFILLVELGIKSATLHHLYFHTMGSPLPSKGEREKNWNLALGYITRKLSTTTLKSTYFLKVSVYLHGCLTPKQCSTSSLNCRYLNHIKFKLTELAIQLYQYFWNRMNCTGKLSFSQLLNGSIWITIIFKATSQSRFCLSPI